MNDSDSDWNRPDVILPRDGEKVEWLDSSGRSVTGTYHHNRWFIGDIYVYYTPTFWRPARER